MSHKFYLPIPQKQTRVEDWSEARVGFNSIVLCYKYVKHGDKICFLYIFHDDIPHSSHICSMCPWSEMTCYIFGTHTILGHHLSTDHDEAAITISHSTLTPSVYCQTGFRSNSLISKIYLYLIGKIAQIYTVFNRKTRAGCHLIWNQGNRIFKRQHILSWLLESIKFHLENLKA